MKVVALFCKGLGFVIGLVALFAVSMALASPFGWPYELFGSWPYLIAAIGVTGAMVLGLTGWPRFATGLVAGSLIVVAIAMASPGDLTRPTTTADASETTTIVWGNTYGAPRNVAALRAQAAEAKADIIATGETPYEGRDRDNPIPITRKGAISVQGCAATNQAFINNIRLRNRTWPRTFAIKVVCPDFTLFAVHLTNPLFQWGERHKRRGEELVTLARAINAETGPVIVLGDFNTPPNAAPLATFLEKSRLSRAACGGRWLPTWRPAGWRGHINDRNPLTGIPIDHVFTRDVDILACNVGKDFGSDHLPLILSVERPIDAKIQSAP